MINHRSKIPRFALCTFTECVSFRHADAYHTQYCLAGLSAAQHHVYPSDSRKQALEQAWVETEPFKPDLGHTGLSQEQRKTIFAKALCWKEEEGASKCVGGAKNRVVSDTTFFLYHLYLTCQSSLRTPHTRYLT